jgi:hypothetical protein
MGLGVTTNYKRHLIIENHKNTFNMFIYFNIENLNTLKQKYKHLLLKPPMRN